MKVVCNESLWCSHNDECGGAKPHYPDSECGKCPFNPDQKCVEVKYTLYRGIKEGNRFCTGYEENKTEEELCKLSNGTIVFTILGYAESLEAAQMRLFGRVFK